MEQEPDHSLQKLN